MAESLRDLAELNHVNSTLASLNFRYEALRASQATGEFNLGNTGSLTSRDKELNEFLMPLREDR